MTPIEKKIDLILEGICLLMKDDTKMLDYFNKRLLKKEESKETACEMPEEEETRE